MQKSVYKKAKELAVQKNMHFNTWSLRKKRIAILQIIGTSVSRRLAEASEIYLPEQRLFFEIINQAVLDATSYSLGKRSSAAEYLWSDDFNTHAGLIGLDTEYAREQIGRAL